MTNIYKKDIEWIFVSNYFFCIFVAMAHAKRDYKKEYKKFHKSKRAKIKVG